MISDKQNEEIKSKIDELDAKIISTQDYFEKLLKCKKNLDEIYQKTEKVQEEKKVVDVKRDVIDSVTGKKMDKDRREILRKVHLSVANKLLA